MKKYTRKLVVGAIGAFLLAPPTSADDELLRAAGNLILRAAAESTKAQNRKVCDSLQKTLDKAQAELGNEGGKLTLLQRHLDEMQAEMEAARPKGVPPEGLVKLEWMRKAWDNLIKCARECRKGDVRRLDEIDMDVQEKFRALEGKLSGQNAIHNFCPW